MTARTILNDSTLAGATENESEPLAVKYRSHQLTHA